MFCDNHVSSTCRNVHPYDFEAITQWLHDATPQKTSHLQTSCHEKLKSYPEICEMDIYLTFFSVFAPANAGIISSGFGLTNSSWKVKNNKWQTIPSISNEYIPYNDSLILFMLQFCKWTWSETTWKTMWNIFIYSGM